MSPGSLEWDGVEEQARDVPVNFRLWVISKVQSRQLFLGLVCKCRWRVRFPRGYDGDRVESLIPK